MNTTSTNNTTGEMICVGLGMKLGADLTPIARSYIEQADVVFVLASSGVVEQWVETLNNNVISLQPFYQEGKSRQTSYLEMIETVLVQVRAGKKVVGAFYGHPGVFAKVPHDLIRKARLEGFRSQMYPGISAEDCLYADLAIDPGKFGIVHYETTQFMLTKRPVDIAAYLVLWQFGMAGDRSLTKFTTDRQHRAVLIDILSQFYAIDHEVILYEAAILPGESIKDIRLPLNELRDVTVSQQTTLIVPPAQKPNVDPNIAKKLARISGNHLRLVSD